MPPPESEMPPESTPFESQGSVKVQRAAYVHSYEFIIRE